MPAFAIKFNRTNYADKLLVYKGHYIDVFLTYEYDLGDGDMNETTVDASAFDALGVFKITPENQGEGFYRVRIQGRFWQVNEAGISLSFSLPYPSTTEAMVLVDLVQIEVVEPIFWTGNPIRLYLSSLSTEPLPLWIEKEYNTGNYELVANIRIPNIRDEKGRYYVDLDKILHRYLAKDVHKDFALADAAEGEDAVQHKFAIRQFHIGHAGTYIETLETEPQPFNTYVVVNGWQNPDLYFRTGNKWGMATEVMSWKAPLPFVQRIGNGEVDLPITVLAKDDLDIVIVNDGNDETLSFFANGNETVVATTQTATCAVVMTTKTDGTRIYGSRIDFVALRPLAFFPGIYASHLVVTEENEFEPKAWMFYRDAAGKLICRQFLLGMFGPNGVATDVVLYNNFLDESWEWACAGHANSNTVVAVAKSAISGKQCLVPFTPNAPFSWLTPNIAAAGNITAVVGLGPDEFVVGVDGVGVFFTNDFGATLTEYIAASGNTNMLLTRLGGSQFLCSAGDTNNLRLWVMNGNLVDAEIINSVDTTPFAHTQAFNAETNNYFVASDFGFYKYSIAGSASTFDVAVGTGIQTDKCFIIATSLANGTQVYFLSQVDTQWKTSVVALVSESWSVTGRIYELPKLIFMKKSVFIEDTAYSVLFKNVAEVVVFKFEYSGEYIRNQRYLWFRNRAGSYEMIFLAGDGEAMPTAKKTTSTRYIDNDSSYLGGEDFAAWVTDAEEELVVNTGWLTKAQYIYFLNELNLSKEAYLLEPDKPATPVSFGVSKPKSISDNPDQYFLELTINRSWKNI